MDMSKMINTVMRLFGRKLIGMAVNKGVDYAARRGKPQSEMTPAELAGAQSARQFAQRAKQIRSVTRRFF
jgi:hypothetical protein